jgi:threonine synthase
MPGSAPFWLQCRLCSAGRPAGSVDYRCARCGGELVVRYRAPFDGTAQRRGRGVWRYADRLPAAGPGTGPGAGPGGVVSLGEGDTPVVDLGGQSTAALGVRRAGIKCEHLNPTGSFKDRIATVAVTLARQRGLAGLAGTSSGNGGAAAAAYCARAGLPLTLFALADILPEKLAYVRALGARVALVSGVGHDAGSTEAAAVAVAAQAVRLGVFPFLTGGRFSPEAMEGAKTIAYEISEQRPEATAVYAPVGGGGLLTMIGRGFAELRAAGVTVPRVVAVQPAGCPTLARALAGDLNGLAGPCTTTISGLQMAILFDPRGARDTVLESQGHVVEVSDEEVFAAQRLLARDSGILVEPAGATALAGAIADARSGRLRPDDELVVLGTGAGFKDGHALARLADGSADPPRIETSQLGDMLAQQVRSGLGGL